MHVKQIGMSPHRVFLGTVFLERLFAHPPLRQRWLTSMLPLGYFYLLGRSFALLRWWNHVEVGRGRQRNVCLNKHQCCAIDFVSGAFFFLFFSKKCVTDPLCVCVGMSGFGVHHDRRGGSAHLDGEALHRTSAVHTRPGRRAGTSLPQLLLHLLCEENRSNPNLTVLKGFSSNMRLSVAPLTTREAQSIITEPLLSA